MAEYGEKPNATGEGFSSAVDREASDVAKREPFEPGNGGLSTDGGQGVVPGDRERTPADETARNDDEHHWAIETTASPSQTFQALSNEARTDILAALYQAELAGNPGLSFSALQDTTDVTTSAGFAYHLRQLVSKFVEKTDDGYKLTFAGRRVAQTVAAGTFTDIVSGSVVLEDPCPLCKAAALSLEATDNDACVTCGGCEKTLMRLPLPPAAQRTREADELPQAFDRHTRHRLALLSDGICPDCGGAIETTIEQLGMAAESLSEVTDGPEDGPLTTGDGAPGEPLAADAQALPPVRAEFDCQGCGQRVRSPLTLTVLDHPMVIAFYDDHDVDVTERPLWNVGSEWREGVISTEPWCARVSSRLDDEVLELYLDADGQVQAARREPAS